jgi:hypothetical protein
MSNWFDRLVQEHKELSAKVDKLRQYLKDNECNNIHNVDILQVQYLAMCTYCDILLMRIKNEEQYAPKITVN